MTSMLTHTQKPCLLVQNWCQTKSETQSGSQVPWPCCPCSSAPFTWLEEAALLHSRSLGTTWEQNLQVTQVYEVLQAMTAGPLLAAQAGFSVPGVLQMPFSIYRNKARTCQYKLLITEDWGSCITSVKSVAAGCCFRLNFGWFKVQLHSSGMVSAGQADAQTVIVWLYEPWMDMPLNASNSTALCPLLLSMWLLDAVGNLSGETLLLLPLGSAASLGSTCSAQQCPCPVARLPRSQRHKGHTVLWLYREGTTKMQTALSDLLWMGLRVISPMEQASWPLFSETVQYFKNLVVYYKTLIPMQTDYSTTLHRPGWPQSVQSNKK